MIQKHENMKRDWMVPSCSWWLEANKGSSNVLTFCQWWSSPVLVEWLRLAGWMLFYVLMLSELQDWAVLRMEWRLLRSALGFSTPVSGHTSAERLIRVAVFFHDVLPFCPLRDVFLLLFLQVCLICWLRVWLASLEASDGLWRMCGVSWP